MSTLGWAAVLPVRGEPINDLPSNTCLQKLLVGFLDTKVQAPPAFVPTRALASGTTPAAPSGQTGGPHNAMAPHAAGTALLRVGIPSATHSAHHHHPPTTGTVDAPLDGCGGTLEIPSAVRDPQVPFMPHTCCPASVGMPSAVPRMVAIPATPTRLHTWLGIYVGPKVSQVQSQLWDSTVLGQWSAAIAIPSLLMSHMGLS